MAKLIVTLLAAAAAIPPAAPLFPFGHSVGSIFAARVAAWRPERCFGALAFKGGLPVPEGSSIAGVPVLVVKGQFEELGKR